MHSKIILKGSQFYPKNIAEKNTVSRNFTCVSAFLSYTRHFLRLGCIDLIYSLLKEVEASGSNNSVSRFLLRAGIFTPVFSAHIVSFPIWARGIDRQSGCGIALMNRRITSPVHSRSRGRTARIAVAFESTMEINLPGLTNLMTHKEVDGTDRTSC